MLTISGLGCAETATAGQRSYSVSNAARSFGRTTLAAFAIAGPALLLAGCGSSSGGPIAEQVEAATKAAERAEAAQKAAEKAAKLAMEHAGSAAIGEDPATEDADDAGASESTDPTDSTGDIDDSGNSDSR